MSHVFECPSCQAQHTVPPEMAGRRVRCPDCGAAIVIPMELAAEIAEDELSFDVGNEPSAFRDASDEPETQLLRMSPATVPDSAAMMSIPGPPHFEPPSESADVDAPIVLRKSGPRDDTEMDMTPMVDVVFQLLIFFMLTAAFAMQRSLEIPKPEENTDQPSTVVQVNDPQDNPEFITVKVDAFNTFHVITVDWEEEAPSEQDLLVKLRRAKSGDSAGRIPTKLLVQANEEAFHDRVVTALDAGMAVKMEEIQLMTVTSDE